MIRVQQAVRQSDVAMHVAENVFARAKNDVGHVEAKDGSGGQGAAGYNPGDR